MTSFISSAKRSPSNKSVISAFGAAVKSSDDDFLAEFVVGFVVHFQVKFFVAGLNAIEQEFNQADIAATDFMA